MRNLGRTSDQPRLRQAKWGQVEVYIKPENENCLCASANDLCLCSPWFISKHWGMPGRCPLLPRKRCEQAAEIATLLADAAELRLAAARALLREPVALRRERDRADLGVM